MLEGPDMPKIQYVKNPSMVESTLLQNHQPLVYRQGRNQHVFTLWRGGLRFSYRFCLWHSITLNWNFVECSFYSISLSLHKIQSPFIRLSSSVNSRWRVYFVEGSLATAFLVCLQTLEFFKAWNHEKRKKYNLHRFWSSIKYRTIDCKSANKAKNEGFLFQEDQSFLKFWFYLPLF